MSIHSNNDSALNRIYIGSSPLNTKIMLLPKECGYTNETHQVTIHTNSSLFPDTFKAWFVNSRYLYIQRTDKNEGWRENYYGILQEIKNEKVVVNNALQYTIPKVISKPIPKVIKQKIVIQSRRKNEKQIIIQDSIPKIIYMTYKTNPPAYVFANWQKLNPDYKIDFSLDSDCITFLNEYFDETFSKMFCAIEKGMYKADLWRLCKLYIHGGVYADIDLVPYVPIDTLIKDGYTFYSCLSALGSSIFQAFMVTPPKNPLILSFIFSFIQNKPYTYDNGPTYDMYNVLKWNLNSETHLLPETKYNLDTVKIKIHIGPSTSNIKKINLYAWSSELEYTIAVTDKEVTDKESSSNINKNAFDFKIINNHLIITKIDAASAINEKNERKEIKEEGWDYNFSICIEIKNNQSIFLFTEKYNNGWDLDSVYVSWNNKYIFKCRYTEFIDIKKKNIEWV